MALKKKLKASKNPRPSDKEAQFTLKEAKKALMDYYKENGLDPTKDHTKHKKHGEYITKMKTIIEVNRRKMLASTPPEIPHKKSEDKGYQKKKEEKAAAKQAKRESLKYDYPLVDGKEMTKEEKRAYRSKMRREAAKGNKDSSKPKEESTPKQKLKQARQEKKEKEAPSTGTKQSKSSSESEEPKKKSKKMKPSKSGKKSISGEDTQAKSSTGKKKRD